MRGFRDSPAKTAQRRMESRPAPAAFARSNVASDVDREALVGGDGIREELTGAGFLLAHGGVVLYRVVVEENELPGSGGLGDPRALFVRAVAPALLGAVLLRR